jgi:cytoplasmic iron level regulating protein YaaA (DUF328/UPF0246 family)
MLILISPAKNLSKKMILYPKSSDIEFVKESKTLVTILKNYKPKDLSSLMKISPKLGELNYERYINWSYPFNSDQKGTALYMFHGDVYLGLKAETFNEKEIEFAQKHLRILSGLYGIIKPLDIILPYRLEMSTKLKTDKGNNLYQFWDNKITERINQHLTDQNDTVLINLASDEYFKSVNLKYLKAEVITPVFKEFKNGKYKTISIFAKKARGLMSNFIIKNQINKPEDLIRFNEENYFYNAELSSKNKLIFVR